MRFWFIAIVHEFIEQPWYIYISVQSILDFDTSNLGYLLNII